MARIITFSSGKGGVGKTTTVANVGTALTVLGKDVVLVDGNLTTPNLSLHFGIPLVPVTLHNVLRGEVEVEDAIYHHPVGVRLIPAGIGAKELKIVRIIELGYALRDLKAEFILLDCAAGLGQEARDAMLAADEVVLITEPELTAVTDALKAKKLASELGKEVTGIVLNKHNRKSQLSKDDVISMLDAPILAQIPHDHAVPVSVAKKLPVVHHKPNAPASVAFKKLAGKLAGQEVQESGVLAKFFSWLRLY